MFTLTRWGVASAARVVLLMFDPDLVLVDVVARAGPRVVSIAAGLVLVVGLVRVVVVVSPGIRDASFDWLTSPLFDRPPSPRHRGPGYAGILDACLLDAAGVVAVVAQAKLGSHDQQRAAI